MDKIINAGTGKKPRRKKREFPQTPKHTEEYEHHAFGAYVNPVYNYYVSPGIVDELKKLFSLYKDAFDRDSILENLTIDKLTILNKEAKNSQKIKKRFTGFPINEGYIKNRDLLGRLLSNLFIDAEYFKYEREHFVKEQKSKFRNMTISDEFFRPIAYTIMPKSSHSEIEMVNLTLPNHHNGTFPYGKLNNGLKKKHFIQRGYHPEAFALEILFRRAGPKKERKGLLIPLTSCDSRIPDEEREHSGHLFAVTYVPFIKFGKGREVVGSKVISHYYNIYDYANNYEQGIRIAIRTRRIYHPGGK